MASTGTGARQQQPRGGGVESGAHVGDNGAAPAAALHSPMAQRALELSVALVNLTAQPAPQRTHRPGAVIAHQDAVAVAARGVGSTGATSTSGASAPLDTGSTSGPATRQRTDSDVWRLAPTRAAPPPPESGSWSSVAHPDGGASSSHANAAPLGDSGNGTPATSSTAASPATPSKRWLIGSGNQRTGGSTAAASAVGGTADGGAWASPAVDTTAWQHGVGGDAGGDPLTTQLLAQSPVAQNALHQLAHERDRVATLCATVRRAAVLSWLTAAVVGASASPRTIA